MLSDFELFCYMHGYPYELVMFILAIIVVTVLVDLILSSIAYWAIFQKAGENGWNAVVPYARLYTLRKIAGGKKKHLLLFGLRLTFGVLGWIFLILAVVALITESGGSRIWVILMTLALVARRSVHAEIFECLAKAFGCDTKFVRRGLVFPITYLYKIAFGQYTFQGN